ncbi:hypothetical protein JTB14_011197 [Gonioctena quinquepunctata]|nr:hypothetical protein JTB14_011197 [Gonioctena quinquepunctata]
MSSESLLAERDEQSVGLLRNMEARQSTSRWICLAIKPNTGVLLASIFDGIGNGIFIFTIYACLQEFEKFPKNQTENHPCSLHGLAFILSVIGLKAAFDSHNLKAIPTPNLYTLHSWIGLGTVIIFAGQFLVGFLSFLYPRLTTNLRKTILPVHTAFGVGGFILAIITTISGLTEKVLWTVKDYQKYPSEGIIFNLIGVATAFYGVMVLYMVNEIDYKRVASVDDEIPLSE